MRYTFSVYVNAPLNIDVGIGYTISSVHNRYNIRMSDVNNNQLSFKLRYNLSGYGGNR